MLTNCNNNKVTKGYPASPNNIFLYQKKKKKRYMHKQYPFISINPFFIFLNAINVSKCYIKLE